MTNHDTSPKAVKELVERLQAARDNFRNAVAPEKMTGFAMLLDEAIAALSPVLPEDVETMRRKLDATAECNIDLAAEASDMIERLALALSWAEYARHAAARLRALSDNQTEE